MASLIWLVFKERRRHVGKFVCRDEVKGARCPANGFTDVPGKKGPEARPSGRQAFLLSHAKAPLREEKRDAATKSNCTP